MSDLFPERPDDVDQLLPVDDEPLSADESIAALDASLNAFVAEDDLVVAVAEPDPIGRGWGFDVPGRHFVLGRDGRGPVNTYGVATLRVWIEMALNTARGAHPIHSDTYGLADPYLEVGTPVIDFDTADLERRVRDAMTFHPRIVDVRRFHATIDPNDDAVVVSFEVVLDDEGTVGIDNLRISGA